MKATGSPLISAIMLISSSAVAQSFDPPLSNPFGTNTESYLFKPQFIDIDADGDLDYFHSSPYGGGFLFQENMSHRKSLRDQSDYRHSSEC